MALEVKSVDLPTGVTLQYVEQGSRQGVPVLLLHGFTDSWRSFERVLPHLPETIRAFALTQRGHGDSGRPQAGYRLRDFAADLAVFMDTLDLDTAVIVGHSSSGAIAQRFVIDHPERTRGLVLIASFADMPNSPVAAVLQDAVAALQDPIEPAFVREFQEGTLAQPVPEDYLDTVVRESLKLPARVWKAAVEDGKLDDYASERGKIEAPTLLVWGGRDGMIARSEQDAQAAEIRDSRLVVYDGAGHAVHWEEPERFAADLVSFIETRVM